MKTIACSEPRPLSLSPPSSSVSTPATFVRRVGAGVGVGVVGVGVYKGVGAGVGIGSGGVVGA